MKRFKILLAITIILIFVMTNACKESFLEITPNGALDESVLGTYEGVDGLLIGAYSLLDGITDDYDWAAATSGWVFADIRGLIANKGTDSGDQPDINPILRYQETATNPYLNNKWRSLYEGISRTNATIRTALSSVESGTITSEQGEWFINQAKALRGFYHFEAWRLWAKADGSGIPYVDQETDLSVVTNTVDVRPLIIADLTAGTNLPNDMDQVGRFNKTVSQVLLAKAEMQMNKDYGKALGLLNTVATSGTNPAGQQAGLEAKYGDIFDTDFRNGVESIYTVQYSVNDGSGARNAGWGEVLNFPYKGGGGSPGGCCGFFQPTQDFVNSFRTSADGLPMIDTYNNEKVTNDQGLAPEDPFTPYDGNLDPRLDWAVGRRGIPYWDWGPVTGSDWVRDQTYAGPYTTKKQVYKKSQEGVVTEVGNWTSGWTANGYRMIRYADVLLLKAECEAMTNADDWGLAEVNLVRNRAANADGFVKNEDGTDAANYVIAPYTSFASADEAMKAIKFERKLELGMEGHRYYDLQRWGDVVTELNRVLTYEKTNEWGPNLYGNATVGSEDVNYPVPQRQIDISLGNLVQNR
jgi:hypothetical protein